MVLLTGEGKYCSKCKKKVERREDIGYFCEECMNLTIPISRSIDTVVRKDGFFIWRN